MTDVQKRPSQPHARNRFSPLRQRASNIHAAHISLQVIAQLSCITGFEELISISEPVTARHRSATAVMVCPSIEYAANDILSLDSICQCNSDQQIFRLLCNIFNEVMEFYEKTFNLLLPYFTYVTASSVNSYLHVQK